MAHGGEVSITGVAGLTLGGGHPGRHRLGEIVPASVSHCRSEESSCGMPRRVVDVKRAPRGTGVTNPPTPRSIGCANPPQRPASPGFRDEQTRCGTHPSWVMAQTAPSAGPDKR